VLLEVVEGMKCLLASRDTDWIWKVKVEFTTELWGEVTEEGVRVTTTMKELTVNDKPASLLDWLVCLLLMSITHIPRLLLNQIAKMEYKCSCGWRVRGLQRQVTPLILQHSKECKLFFQKP